MVKRREYRVEEDEGGLRLDQYLTLKREDLSRSYLQTLIHEGHVQVDGTFRKKGYGLSPGETITLHIPPPKDSEPTPQDLPLDILYEDRSLIVINKEPGLVVHPAPGHKDRTLVNALLFHIPDLAGIGGVRRPGIVHRLDKDTSGVMVVAKEDGVHRHLKEQFSIREVKKVYLALVQGAFPYDHIKVETPIGRDPHHRKRMAVSERGKMAISHFTVKRRLSTTTLLQVGLKTGRMHQIRVHASYLGCPVVGDMLYGRKRGVRVKRQLLHSFSLGFNHPGRGEWMEFKAPLPLDFRSFLKEERRRGGEEGSSS